MNPPRCFFRGFGLLLLLGSTMLSHGQEQWPRFRGVAGAGVSSQKGLPVQWEQGDYEWKTALPGLGHGSPSVWDEHLFLVSAEADGKSRVLLDIDTTTGKIRWQRNFTGQSYEKHELNSFASATPATDGKYVVTLFASDQDFLVVAHDFTGQEIWKRDLGKFYNRHSHGCGTSPILFEGQVIIANQQDGASSVVALDVATGKTRWKSERKVRLTAHSTPVVLARENQVPRLFFTNTGDGISSLDALTGKLLSRANVFNARCVGSPVVVDNVVVATCGGGGRGQFLAAIPVDGDGDLSVQEATWTRERNLPYVPTPLAYQGHLFLWGDNGVVVCLEAATGREIWTQRVGGIYSGSPVCIDGKLYCIARDGTVVVMVAGPKYELLGKTSLGDACHSTPAVAGGRMFIRGFKHLYCLRAR
ncbi:MAG: hypothetical protein CMJ70_00905 [Planctomycetaceae bacterium]|nr:hypothetical protein [Planctomycetaceae bacterium]|tara:strand:+ start:1413 stop:2663 length:1251 start_codon:yes stop_codon:yes gene_type:complete